MKYVTAAEAKAVGPKEAAVREALRTPLVHRTEKQKALAKAWSAENRKRAVKWYRDRGITPVNLMNF
jgi:hypothetical protein